MKVIFANDSLNKLKFLALSANRESGFLMTESIGNYTFITDLINVDLFESTEISGIENIHKILGNKVGGIYISEKFESIPDYFFGKLILTLNSKIYSIEYFDSDLRKRRLIEEGIF